MNFTYDETSELSWEEQWLETEKRQLDAEFEYEDHFKKFPNRLGGIDDLFNYEPEPMLIDGWIPRRGFGQMYGASYSGKTYAALDLALSVCAGLREWMGLPLLLDGPQHVIYVAAEGGMPFRDAVLGWSAAHPGADLSRFHYLDGGKGHVLQIAPDQSDVPLEARFNRLVMEVNALVGDDPIAMVVMDPQINILSQIDENSNRDMAEVMAELKRIADATGTLLLMVHHTGHTTGRARGASSQFGMMDLVIELEGHDGEGVITFRKVKGAARPKDGLAFKIDYVDIDGGKRQGSYLHIDTNSAYLSPEAQTDLLAHSRKREIKKAMKKPGVNSALTIASETKVNRNEVARLLKEMVTDGTVINNGNPSRPNWVLIETGE